MAAVCDSITPSAINLTAPVLSTRIVGEARAHLLELVEAGLGERGVGAQRLVDAQRQLAALAQAIEQLEIGGGAAGVLHAGDADAMRFVDRGADRGEAIFFGRLRRGRGHQRHRRFLQRAGRLAGARILHDDAVGRSLGAARDARELQRLACSPSRCGRRRR